MKSVALLVVLAGACSFEHGTLLTSSDAAPTPDGPPGCVSFSSQVDTCTVTAGANLDLSGMNTYDTTTGTLLAGSSQQSITRMAAQGKAGPIEVLLVHDLHLATNARLRATGNVPLAIIASGTITLDAGAIIDASSGGAGARTTCTGGAVVGTNDSGGAGGGGGGGFGDAGGTGGTGNSDGSPAPGGTGGTGEPTPAGPLGGCPGARGGDGNDSGGGGGAGGGAIYAASPMRIDVGLGAGIQVGGGGGRGGDVSFLSDGDAGGGGGGSGGMIMLEAPLVSIAGTLAANGGGGGEASGGGNSGSDGSAGLFGTERAPGGSGNSSSGTEGGSGGALATHVGETVTSTDTGGGGGGGGGVGYIVIRSPSVMITTASPDPS